jgi:chromosome segregation ATPase
MATYDERIAALEKDAATMKRDIIYKLDDTNSAVTIIRGLLDNQQRDIREIKGDVRDIRSDVRTINVHLDGVDTRLEGLKEEVRAVKQQLDGEGQDIKEIKRRLDTFEERVEERFTSVEGMLAQILLRLSNPPTAE